MSGPTPEEQWLREREHAALMSRAFPPIGRTPDDPEHIVDQSPAQESPAVLDPDQRAILMTPKGVRYTLLLIALLKRALQDDTLRTAFRLQLLEQLDELADTSVLTAIDPMDEVGVQMLDAAMSLDKHVAEPPHHASFDMLTRGDVFAHFIRLNPSLLTATQWAAHERI